jgi:hypothetical protein
MDREVANNHLDQDASAALHQLLAAWEGFQWIAVTPDGWRYLKRHQPRAKIPDNKALVQYPIKGFLMLCDIFEYRSELEYVTPKIVTDASTGVTTCLDCHKGNVYKDPPDASAGLHQLLEAWDDFLHLAETGPGRQAIRRALKKAPTTCARCGASLRRDSWADESLLNSISLLLGTTPLKLGTS